MPPIEIHLRPDEYSKIQNGVTITVCIASDDPDEKYRELDIHPPRPNPEN